MTLVHILAFSIFALIGGWVIPTRWRVGFFLAASLAIIYWLQPATPIRYLGFWLPTLALGLTILVWIVTQDHRAQQRRTTFITAALLLGVILFIALTRYMGIASSSMAARPPAFSSVIAILGGIASLCLAVSFYRNKPSASLMVLLLILCLFFIFKTDSLTQGASAVLRRLSHQDTTLASPQDFHWLGFSYLAFRLLHVLQDYRSGRLGRFSLKEFAGYSLFFPAYLAGPIDRSDRFIQEVRSFEDRKTFFFNLQDEHLIEGGKRILMGIFKKFVLADNLALIALNNQTAGQIEASFWMWVALYAYGLRLYLDFSGYTDIALGLGRWMGVKLPENFLSPYTKTNMTSFWNSWHITLAQWFRAYFFNPLTRALRRYPNLIPAWVIIIIGQFATMLLIGLWHGVTWNFALWGLWHGTGLFINNRWSQWRRSREFSWGEGSLSQSLQSFGGWALTFNYVMIGWVWFALAEPTLSWRVLRTLFGA